MSELIIPKNESESKSLSEKVRKGLLNRVRQGIYTDAPLEEIPDLINKKWVQIVAYLIKDPVASYRTAAELRPVDGNIYITSSIKSRKKYAVTSSLTINVIPGDTEILTENFLPGILRSSLTRQLLENLSNARVSKGVSKTLGVEWVESKLCSELSTHGEDRINEIRDKAKRHSASLGMNDEYIKLNKIIGSLLSSMPIDGNLTSPIAVATAMKEPFDINRQQLFQQFAQYLKDIEFTPVDFKYNKSAWRNLSFFESYFSNYIEGTEFEIDEAEEIVFSEREISGRHEDSHDVLSVYNIVSDYQEMVTTPNSSNTLIEILKEKHSVMMVQRPGKNPGQFKTRINRAGSSIFVSPENLIGTLKQGFEYYKGLPEGLSRAIFIQFLIAECHPFDDGNGRLSRIMMNAELVSTGQFKIIVPTVHRDSYLNGLRQATRQSLFRTITKVFYQLQQYTASINWSEYGDARDKIEEHRANLLPDEGVAKFNLIIRDFKKTFKAG